MTALHTYVTLTVLAIVFLMAWHKTVTLYAMLLCGIPWDILHVICIFLVYTLTHSSYLKVII